MRDLPVRMARWSAGHPWRAIVGWFLFVALCLRVGVGVGGNAATTEDYRVGEAGRAETIAAAGGLQNKPVERVLITAAPGTGRFDERSAAGAAREVAAQMRALPQVEAVGAPVWSPDGAAVRVDVTMRGAELDEAAPGQICWARSIASWRSPHSLPCASSASPSLGASR